jgi:hypothetical protein
MKAETDHVKVAQSPKLKLGWLGAKTTQSLWVLAVVSAPLYVHFHERSLSPKAPSAFNPAQTLGLFAGSLIFAFILWWILRGTSWIVFRVTGRSHRAARITFATLLVLWLLGASANLVVARRDAAFIRSYVADLEIIQKWSAEASKLGPGGFLADDTVCTDWLATANDTKDASDRLLQLVETRGRDAARLLMRYGLAGSSDARELVHIHLLMQGMHAHLSEYLTLLCDNRAKWNVGPKKELVVAPQETAFGDRITTLVAIIRDEAIRLDERRQMWGKQPAVQR